MNDLLTPECMEKIKGVYADAKKVSPNRFEVEQEYEYVDVSFRILCKLSEILKTKNIDVRTENFTSGCETCDYGSSYTAEFEVWAEGEERS